MSRWCRCLRSGHTGTIYSLSKRTDIYTVLAHLRASNTYNPGAEGTAAGMNNNQSVFTVGLRHKF